MSLLEDTATLCLVTECYRKRGDPNVEARSTEARRTKNEERLQPFLNLASRLARRVSHRGCSRCAGTSLFLSLPGSPEFRLPTPDSRLLRSRLPTLQTSLAGCAQNSNDDDLCKLSLRCCGCCCSAPRFPSSNSRENKRAASPHRLCARRRLWLEIRRLAPQGPRQRDGHSDAPELG